MGNHLPGTRSPLSSMTRLPLIYRREYNITFLGLEKLHPFDSQKYARVLGMLVAAEALVPQEITIPDLPSEEVLLTVHSRAYLDSLKSSMNVARITEVIPVAALPPSVVRSRVLVPFLYATGGTILGAQLALQHGWAINLGGGFHHASAERGGGFCAYADITLAIRTVQAAPSAARKCMIIDLDAHQGNGHERDFEGDESVFIMDVFNGYIYPKDTDAKRGIDIAVELKPGAGDDEYLRTLRSHLSAAFQRFQPDLIIYNAGTDCLAGDPLGVLNVSAAAVIERDEMVFMDAFSRRIPILMVLSGGYQHNNARVITDSILNLNSKFRLFDSIRLGAPCATDGVVLDSVSCPTDAAPPPAAGHDHPRP